MRGQRDGRGPIKGTAPEGRPRPQAQQRAQQRARYAWECVDVVDKRDDKRLSDRYGTLARKLPGYLQVSGLGQTLAFLFAKSKGGEGNAEALLLKHLGEHLHRTLTPSGAAAAAPPAMELVLSLSPAQYRQATREAVVLAEWLKRFAEGKLGEEEG